MITALISSLVMSAAPPAFVRVKPSTVCLAEKPREKHLPHAVWNGSRFVITWYEKNGAALEQHVGLFEEMGEPVGESTRTASLIDGASSAMGRLAFSGTQLGATWEDDQTGKRTTLFRVLDKQGAAKGEPMVVSRDFLAHGEQPAIAWNAQTESWGVLFTGTQDKGHHKYLSVFRGEPGPAIRLDDEATIESSHNIALVARGRCFLTAWISPTTQAVTVGEKCEGEPIKRVAASDQPVRAQQAALVLGRESVLVAWTAAAKDAAGDDVNLSLLDASGKVKARLTLGGAGLAQSPSLHFDGVSFWVTWSEAVGTTERVWLAQLNGDGTLANKAEVLPGEWAGPIWATFAVSEKKLNVIASHPNDTRCSASFIVAARR